MPIVTLISYTPDPVRTVAAAAKLCYSRSGIETLLDNLDEHKANDFVEMLSDLGHESPIEHASFTFGIEGVSRAFLAQITRHRLASYSVQRCRRDRDGACEGIFASAVAALLKEPVHPALVRDVEGLECNQISQAFPLKMRAQPSTAAVSARTWRAMSSTGRGVRAASSKQRTTSQ